MSDLPEPLTPADCDLRGLPFMPLDTIRIIDSDLFAVSSGDEFKAALALWCKSWQQIPAASLPDDDRVLAHLSGAGTRWKKVKNVALRNWIKCSDGRLYHPVVAEKAIEALPMRREYRDRKSGEADRKAREREDRKAMFAKLRAAGVTPEYNIKTSELRALVTKHVTAVTGDVTEHVTPVTEHVTAKTGTGTGTGTVKEEGSTSNDVDGEFALESANPPPAPSLKPEHFRDAWNDLAERIGRPQCRDLTPERRQRLKARINGYSLDDFRIVLGSIEQSRFLRGDTGWPGCTFDWVTKKENFQKILEGNYNG